MAIRDQRYRLVKRTNRSRTIKPVYELYDLVADPGETKNTAGGNPQVMARLRAHLAAQPDPSVSDS